MRRKGRKGEATASPASQAGFSDRGPDGLHTTPRLPYTQNGDGRDGGDDDSRLVIGYVRVSTEDQADNGISLEEQKSRIEAYATAQDPTPYIPIALFTHGMAVPPPMLPRLPWCIVSHPGGAAILSNQRFSRFRLMLSLHVVKRKRNA